MARQTLFSEPGRVESLTLIGGRLCLDFVNTVDPRHGERSSDYLTNYGDLVRWAVHAGALSSAAAEGLLSWNREDSDGAERADQAFLRAVEFRDRLYDLLSALAAGKPPGGEASGRGQCRVSTAAAGARPPSRRRPRGGFGWGWDDDERSQPGLVARRPLGHRVPSPPGGSTGSASVRVLTAAAGCSTTPARRAAGVGAACAAAATGPRPAGTTSENAGETQ